MTTERQLGGESERTSLAESSRSSFEYMLMRWLMRKAGSSFWYKVLMILAWMARPSLTEE